ncbi:MAG TPA: PspA/IM30 family protein [Chroococcales cyanobacterium]
MGNNEGKIRKYTIIDELMAAMGTDDSDKEQDDSLLSALDAIIALPSEHRIDSSELIEFLTLLINQVRDSDPEFWKYALQQLRSELVKIGVLADKSASLGGPSEVSMELEDHYQGLQSQLISVRQSVAQAIAMERQLEVQVQRNKEMSKTWDTRVQLALSQNNEDLAAQARARQQQYIDAEEELTTQLAVQQAATAELRKRLTSCEDGVQRAYVVKQSLSSRESVAQASIRANELMDKLNEELALEKIQSAKEKVEALERLSQPDMTSSCSSAIDTDDLLIQTVNALERATLIISALESRLSAETQE